MLPDVGLITKADKQKLDSLPSDTLLTKIEAAETYLAKDTASTTYITRADAQRYINDALDGGGSSALGTINSSAATFTAKNDGYYYKVSYNSPPATFQTASNTIFSSASNCTIEAGPKYPLIYNDGDANCYFCNGLSETIFGFGKNDTLIVPSGDFSIKPANDGEGLRVNHGLGSTLLRGKRIEGTTGYDADNFLTIPAGTKLNIQAKNLNRTAYEAVLGTANAETIWNDGYNEHDDLGEHVWIKAAAGNDVIINRARSYCTIEPGQGTDYVYDESGGNNVYVYNAGDGILNICGFTENDTLVINGITAPSIQGYSDGSFYVYQNTSNYVRLWSSERKEQYTTEQYYDKYSTSYYWPIEGGTYINIKNNSDELIDVVTGPRLDGGGNNRTGNRWDNTMGRDYCEIVFNATNQTAYNKGYNCTISASLTAATAVDTIFNDLQGGVEIFRRTTTSGTDFYYGYDGASILQITDGSSDSVICCPTVDGGYAMIFSPTDYNNTNKVIFKGDRIEGTTAYNAAAYLPLGAAYDINVVFGESDEIITFNVPEVYYMTATRYTNTADNIWVCGTNAANSIENSGDNVSINACEGANKVTNEGAECFIMAGTGYDSIWNNEGGEHCTIYGGSGNNRIENKADNVSILGGTGNDSIINCGDNVSVNGGTGTAWVTLQADGENLGRNCYIETAGYTNATLNTYAPTLVNNSDYTSNISLGADCSHASIICAAGNITDTIRTTGGAGTNGHHYIHMGGAYQNYPNYCYICDAYNTIAAGVTYWDYTYFHNPDSLNGAGSHHNLIELGNGLASIHCYGSYSNTIIGGTSTEYICYYKSDANYSTLPEGESIVTGVGTDYITLYGGRNCTIESGAGNDVIRIPDSRGSNIYFFGNGEGNNNICGAASDDTLFIKDDSTVSVGANNSSGLAVKIGTNTYVTLKGALIAGKTDFAAAASYSSIDAGAQVCTIKYSNGTTNTLYAP